MNAFDSISESAISALPDTANPTACFSGEVNVFERFDGSFDVVERFDGVLSVCPNE
jgi:hypothetical protein